MGMKSILNFISAKYEADERVSEDIIKQLEDTILEMEAAESMFNTVSDSKLIEAAIYREVSAKRKFDYLISLAKEEYGGDYKRRVQGLEL